MLNVPFFKITRTLRSPVSKITITLNSSVVDEDLVDLSGESDVEMRLQRTPPQPAVADDLPEDIEVLSQANDQVGHSNNNSTAQRQDKKGRA